MAPASRPGLQRAAAGLFGAALLGVGLVVLCGGLDSGIGLGDNASTMGREGRRIELQALPQPIVIDSMVDADSGEEAARKAAVSAGVTDAHQSGASWGGGYYDGGRTVQVQSNLGGDLGQSIKEAFGSVAQQIASHVVDSVLSPKTVYPLQWRKANDQEGKGYESTATVMVPRLVPPTGTDTPVQLNTKIVFPRPPSKERTIVNPCAVHNSGCSGGQSEMYTEKDMAVRIDAVRKRADERLADARRNWEDEVLATKQRFRERIQGLKQRSDALANQIRRLEAGGGKRMDLPQYVRVRNRVAGVSDAVAKLIADENLLQTHIDHVLEAPGPRGKVGAMGPQGPRGMRGLPGPRGLPGSNGLSGRDGKPGANGEEGPPGSRGPPGPPGMNGLPGANGPAGPVGFRGDEGPQGPTGFPGFAGRDGIPGTDGIDGKSGPPGAPGRNGKDGRDGNQGPVGPPGLNGPPGLPGQNGQPGPPGLPGPVGPEGPQGPPGPEGPAGPNGMAGPKGPDGDPGPEGVRGLPGYIGKDGMPGPPGAPREFVTPPSPALPVHAPPGTAAPGVNVLARSVVAYTPAEYAPIITAAIAQAVNGGCGCVTATTVIAVRQQCPCVQQYVAEMKAKGSAIKQALSQVIKATTPTERKGRR